MIKFIGSLPKHCTVAFSGGVDSVAVADFLLRGKREVRLAFFHHGTGTSDAAQSFVEEFARDRGVELVCGRLLRDRRGDESQEEFWREERYRFLSSLEGEVVTAHHLDDAVETWLFNSIHGKPRTIPYRNGNVVRPFLTTPKAELVSWCQRKGLKWTEDATNCDVAYMRNLIRHQIVPNALKVNPGLRTVVRKMYSKTEDVRPIQ
jgi:tRNA(Ile)-lysidine synthase